MFIFKYDMSWLVINHCRIHSHHLWYLIINRRQWDLKNVAFLWIKSWTSIFPSQKSIEWLQKSFILWHFAIFGALWKRATRTFLKNVSIEKVSHLGLERQVNDDRSFWVISNCRINNFCCFHFGDMLYSSLQAFLAKLLVVEVKPLQPCTN